MSGTDDSAHTDAEGHRILSGTPAGLAIVDTRDWTIRMLDPDADDVAVGERLLLATGRRWSTDSTRMIGMGLAGYGPDRELRFRLFPGSASWIGFTFGARAYVGASNRSTKLSVVDLATGRVIGKRPVSMPMPLLRDGPEY